MYVVCTLHTEYSGIFRTYYCSTRRSGNYWSVPVADGLVPKWWWCKHIYGKHLSCCVKMIWYGRSDIAIQHDSRKFHIHRAPWSWRLLLVCFVWPVYSIFCMINPWWRVRSTGDGYWWWYMKTVSWLKLCCNAFPHGQPWLSLYSVLRRIIFPLLVFPFFGYGWMGLTPGQAATEDRYLQHSSIRDSLPGLTPIKRI